VARDDGPPPPAIEYLRMLIDEDVGGFGVEWRKGGWIGRMLVGSVLSGVRVVGEFDAVL
jgi:hypothetical protein